VTPTHPDDEAFGAVFGVPLPSLLRYKISVMLNDRLSRAAAATGATYLDLWQRTMRGRHIRPEFALDVCHVNDRGALATMSCVMENLRARGTEVEAGVEALAPS
jgi:hypothetical protein